MALKDDLARLKRLSDPNSDQWVKVQSSIENIVREIITPFYPNKYYFSDPRWHKLPWGYQLKHWSWAAKGEGDFRYVLQKFDGDRNLIFCFSGHDTEIWVLIDLAVDISNGWLDEIKKSSRAKLSEK